MLPQCVENLSHVQCERLAYIDFRLYFMGDIGRPDLAKRFGLAPAAATRDLALYRELAPDNIAFDGSSKIYRMGKRFAPLFAHSAQRVLSVMSHGFGDGVNTQPLPMLPCATPALLSCPRIDVLAPVCRAIHGKRPLAMRYYSMTQGETERVIVPFALLDTGLYWKVRAFDRSTGAFRDFAINRIAAPELLDEAPSAGENPENDMQWTRIVELKLTPHPRLAHPEIVKMDYGMEGGVMRLHVRAAVAGYMLASWKVDTSPDHSLHEEQYRLWLSDPLALYGVENAKLAPGYRAPQGKTSK
ncbi:WYL domain-containing protein [Massilia sp. W12]|uniref:transcriptional regulator n=1 Tax=Massilia sp. W12 TaxID=3126507 RepID=UPI0030CBDB41